MERELAAVRLAGRASAAQGRRRALRRAGLSGTARRGMAVHHAGRSLCARMPFEQARRWPNHAVARSGLIRSRNRCPRGVIVCSLAEAIAKALRTLSSAHLARHADYSKHPFTALNTAFLRDGAFVHIPAGHRGRASRSICASRPRPQRDAVRLAPPLPRDPRRQQPGDAGRELQRPAGDDVLHQRRHRDRRRRRRGRRSLQGAARGRSGVPHGRHAGADRPGRQLLVARRRAGRAVGPQRDQRRLRGRGRRMHPQRSVSGERANN